MKVSVQIVVHHDDEPDEVREVLTLHRDDALAPELLGLQLDEARNLLTAAQSVLVDHQVATALAAAAACPDCGARRRHKDHRSIVMRTLFGRLRLDSPRWWHCACRPRAAKTFSPLAVLLPERATPELSYLQARFAGLVSYAFAADLLGEVLPLGQVLHATTVRRQTQAAAARLEDELGEEQGAFIDGCPADWAALPRPDLPLLVGLDGGYVHSSQGTRHDGWFEVIAGKAVPAEGKARTFAFVQAYDTKPKRRLYEVLKAQGMAANQQVTFLTDGGADIRELPYYLNPDSEHLLDWFHVTMRLTVLGQLAKGLRTRAPTAEDTSRGDGAEQDGAEQGDGDDTEDLQRYHDRFVTALPGQLERLKRFLWHGNVFRALQIIDDLEFDLDVLADTDTATRKLATTVAEFAGYIRANTGSIPNYGERYRAGETITTAFVESTVNQVVSKRMVKKQQMRWTPRGAHLLLQIRTRVLNGTLAEDYQRWYPGFSRTSEKAALQDQLVAA